MSDQKSLAAAYWCNVERKHCLENVVPGAESDADHRVHLSQYQQWNARLGEALVLTESVNPLLKIRALLFRGKIAEGTRLVNDVLSAELEPLADREVSMERARIQFLLGHWEAGLTLVDSLLTEGPEPASHLALWQMRALAHFELGHWAKALGDLRKIESLKEVLPYSVSRHYADALRVKLLARTRDLATARRSLGEIWNRLAHQDLLTPDSLSVLFRVEVDLRRLEGRDPLPYAVASYLMENLMGDELYSSLALLDIYFSSPLPAREALSDRVRAAARRFERVKNLLDEVEGAKEGPRSTTAESVQRHRLLATPLEHGVLFGDGKMEIERIEHLFLVPQDLRVQVAPFACRRAKSSPQVRKALGLAKRGDQSKEAFFTSLWKIRYSSALHDGLIRNLLSRSRKETGLPLRLREGFIQFQNLLVLE